MDTAVSALKWLGIGLVFLVAGFFLLAFVIGVIKFVRESMVEAKGTGAGVITTVASDVVEKLSGGQVFLIGAWYLLNLAVVGQVAFLLLEPHPADPRLRLLQNSVTALFVVRCYCCGSVGATVHGMMALSKRSRRTPHNTSEQWLQRRYLLLPILGGLLGAFSYFFLAAGMLTLQAGATAGGGAAGAAGAAGAGAAGATSTAINPASSFAVYGVAFLSGFASRELTYKLIQIARTVFARPPELGESGEPAAASDDA